MIDAEMTQEELEAIERKADSESYFRTTRPKVGAFICSFHGGAAPIRHFLQTHGTALVV